MPTGISEPGSSRVVSGAVRPQMDKTAAPPASLINVFHRKLKLLPTLTEDLVSCRNQPRAGRRPRAQPVVGEAKRRGISLPLFLSAKTGWTWPGWGSLPPALPSLCESSRLGTPLPREDGEPQRWFLMRPHTPDEELGASLWFLLVT